MFWSMIQTIGDTQWRSTRWSLDTHIVITVSLWLLTGDSVYPLFKRCHFWPMDCLVTSPYWPYTAPAVHVCIGSCGHVAFASDDMHKQINSKWAQDARGSNLEHAKAWLKALSCVSRQPNIYFLEKFALRVPFIWLNICWSSTRAFSGNPV